MRARALWSLGSMVVVSGLTGGAGAAAQDLALASRTPRFLYVESPRAAPVEIDVGRTAILSRVVSLRVEEATVSSLLAEIERQTGLAFAYGRYLRKDRAVTLQADSITVASALAAILYDAGVDVVLSPGGHVSLVPAKTKPQPGRVVGQVTDQTNNQGIAGAEVLLEGTKWRTLTGEDGRYVLAEVTPASYTITARRIGFAKRSEPVTVGDGQEVVADLALQPAPTTLGELVVTAQKREERLIDVPISIVAISADELQQRRVTRLDDLSLAVPGLHVQSGSGDARQIQMRGVSNFQGRTPLIGLYLDEASVTIGSAFRQPDLPTYDLERVEVLRGPQGTLYGEGAAGGTIRFITKNPVLDQFAVNTNLAAMVTQDGAPGQRIEGVANVPLIENELGLRIAGTFDHQGGWVDQPAADRKNFNDQDLLNVRVKGLWQPVAQFTVNAMAVVHRNDASSNLGEDADGNYTQTFNLATTPDADDDYNVYNLTLTYDVPAVRVLSTTTYIEQHQKRKNIGVILQLTPPGTPPFHVYLPQHQDRNNVFNQELRLTSTGSGPWRWTVGGFYRRSISDVQSSFLFALPDPSEPLPDPFAFQTNRLSESWAVFGDASYRLTDRLTLGTGLRYFEDDQEDRISGQTGTFDALSPRGYVQYKLTDQVNTYASVAKGFRSGGFNALDQPPFDPEHIWTYELGTKMSLLEGRLAGDVAIFYSDYTDYIVFGSVGDPPVNIQSNAGDATIKGIEWGLTGRPTDRWSLSFNGHYVQSEFTEINAGSTSHAVGDPLDFYPEYRYTVSVQRDFVWNGRPGFTRLDYNQQGRTHYRVRSIGPWYFDQSNIISMLNFHTSLQWNDNLSLGLFAQNLLNDRGFTGAGNLDRLAPRSRPLTFGVEFGATF